MTASIRDTIGDPIPFPSISQRTSATSPSTSAGFFQRVIELQRVIERASSGLPRPLRAFRARHGFRVRIGSAAACLALAVPALAGAQDASRANAGADAAQWPTKAVQLIVPSTPGSSLDVVARALAEDLRKRWNQPVTVMNRPGAGGMIGMEATARATPDGHVLGVGFNGPIAYGPYMYRKMPYDPQKDLVPVIMTTMQPNALAVPHSAPYKDLRGFLDHARRLKDGLTYGSVGNGSASHLTMELMKSSAGFEAVHVPYNGSTPAAAALVSGEIQALFSTLPALLPLVHSQKVRILGVTSLERMKTHPDYPTLAESGLKGFEALTWNGLFAASGTPKHIIDRINRDTDAALKDGAVRGMLERAGLVPTGGTAEAFAKLIEDEQRKWEPIIRKAGITVD